MKKGNILLVVILVLIAGVIVGLSFLMAPPSKEKVGGQTPPASTPGGSVAPDSTKPPAHGFSSQSPVVGPATEKAGLPVRGTQAGDTLLETTFEKGLNWLLSQQRPDGAWANFPEMGNTPDVAFTSFPVIIIAEAPARYRQAYQTKIDKSIQYILSKQRENGSFIDSEVPPVMVIYKTSLAIVALATWDKEKYKDQIFKGRTYLEKSQFGPEDGSDQTGGWGYQEKPDKEPAKNANMSTTSYAIWAAHLAELPKDSEVYKNAVEFITKCQSYSETNKYRAATGNDGGLYYAPNQSKVEPQETDTLPDGTKILRSYASMTYSGLLSMIYAFIDKNDPRVQAAYRWIKEHYTLDKNIGMVNTQDKPRADKEGLYYYYHTFAKALDAYGEETLITLPDNQTHYWSKDLVAKLAAVQKPEGLWINDADRWGENYAPLPTSYALMSLNICRQWVK